MFVAGHAGVRGSEKADRLTGLATADDGQPVDLGDIVNDVREL